MLMSEKSDGWLNPTALGVDLFTRREQIVLIAVNLDEPGIVMPTSLQDQRLICLQIGEAPADENLEFATDALHVTLWFDDMPFRTIIPWAAIKGIQAQPSQNVRPIGGRHLQLV